MTNQHYERENPRFWDKKKEKDMTREQLEDARQIIFLLERKMSTLENLIQNLIENTLDDYVRDNLEYIKNFIITNKL